MDEDIKKSVLKTGTTIVGIVCKDGVIIAADRRVTAGGSLIMSKDENKVFKVNEYLVTAGTGVAADIHRVPKLLAAELKLKELQSGRRPSVKAAASLLGQISYSGIRQPSVIPQQAGFLLGGYDLNGSVKLYTIEPAGGVYEVKDYDANFGSGMPYVLGYLERNYKKELSVKEGVELAIESIKSSIERDTGSGNGMDVYVITKDKIEKVDSIKISPNFKKE